MLNALKISWALFLGLTLIMIGNGLGGTLVGVRTQVEAFDNTLTGVVMAGYFAGFFVGSLVVPKMMAQVGHVRVFGALTALASLAILIFPMIIDPWVWTLMRFLTGIAYAGLYIVVESWLNDKATNETRGQLLAIYLVVSSLGVAGGQLLLNLYDPANFELFTVVSILISVAAVPVLVSAARAPEFETPEAMGPFRLYKISPLGTFGMFLVGTTAGTLIGMGPAYGYKMYGTEFASLMMTAVFVGAFMFTWPIGKLSDRFDRRTVIVACASLCLTASFLGIFFDQPHDSLILVPYEPMKASVNEAFLSGENMLLFVCLLVGGFAFPLYSLCIAHTNDYLSPKQMVAASSTLIMANGFGAMIGPSLGGLAMDLAGPPGFFWALVSLNILFVCFGLYRMLTRPALTSEEQGNFVAVDAGMTVVATTNLHPEMEWQEEGQKTPEEEGESGFDSETEAPWDDLPQQTKEEYPANETRKS